jgi:hypothetical protein
MEIDQIDKEAQERSREVNEQLNIEEGEGPTSPIVIDSNNKADSSSKESHAEDDDEILVLTDDEAEPNYNGQDQGSASPSHPEVEEGQSCENEDEDVEVETGIEIEPSVAEDPQAPETASSEIQDFFEIVRGTPRPECLLCKTKLKIYRFNDVSYCEPCILKELSQQGTSEGRVDAVTRYEFVIRINQVEKFKSELTHLPVKLVPFQDMRTVLRTSMGLLGRGKVRLRPIKAWEQNFADVLMFEKIDGIWMCCENRAQNADLSRYWKIREGKYVEEVHVEANVQR